MSKVTTRDEPTRRTIESFLRYDIREKGVWEDPEYKKITDEMDRLEKEFRATPRMKRLARKQDEMRHRSRMKKERREAKALRLRRLYNTHGLTKRVIREFQKLAEELNRDRS